MDPTQSLDVIGGGQTWLDGVGGFFGNILGTVSDTASGFASGWLNDSFGQNSNPQNALERPQAQNADVANAPSVAFGFSQVQLLIGGVVAVGIFFLARKK